MGWDNAIVLVCNSSFVCITSNQPMVVWHTNHLPVLTTQAIIVAILIIPFAALGAFIYYKNDRTPHGLLVGFIIALTALVLDALMTVPLVEIPKGNSYEDFFTYPLLWLLVVINIATVYIYWRLKLMNQINNNLPLMWWRHG